MNVIKKGYQAVKNVVMPSQSQMLNPYQLLLIGETGSGKTSFLNLICNFDLIQKLGFETGVDQFKRFNDMALENAETQQMESKTSYAKLYNAVFYDLKVGIIDTPGFGDSRGMNEDKEHVKKIIETLKEVEYVNCVCLVINGRNSRMTGSLRYVLSEITSILPKKILNNVFVVFTNTANPLMLNFDLHVLKQYFGKEITTCFCIENPYCNFDKAKKLQGELNISMIAKSLKKAFEETGEVLIEMYTAMKPFDQVHTSHFTKLYEKKQEIERKVIEMFVSYDNEGKNKDEIKKMQEKVEAAARTKTLNEGFHTVHTQERWVAQSTSSHNTLCGFPNCYSTCHESCGLDKTFKREDFLRCAAFCLNTKCGTCSHSYMEHYHNEIKMALVKESTDSIDEVTKEKFEKAKNMEEKAAVLLDDLKNQLDKSKEKRKKLSEKLLLTMEEFHQLGLNKNYAKVLESQLYVVTQRIESDNDNDDKELLRATEKELTTKLELVTVTLKEPWSSKADPTAQREWACTVLGISATASITGEIVSEAYKKKARESHPDKGGDDESFKRIKRAREILVQ